MDLGQFRTMFIKDHNIRFKSFSCNDPLSTDNKQKQLFDHMDPEPINYGISDIDEWNAADQIFKYSNITIIIQHENWLGCTCNPQKFNHKCSAVYESSSGWTLEKIMAAARHHYLWSCLSSFFSKQRWRGALTTANTNDLKIFPYDMDNNQLGEDAYISNLIVSYSLKEELIVSYYSYR